MVDWRSLLVAGLGGGALSGLAEGFLGKLIPPGEVFGLTFKDIALILLGAYGADRTTGDLSTALRGMAVIQLYKTVYPRFVEPMIAGFVPAGSSGGHSSPKTSSSNSPNSGLGRLAPQDTSDLSPLAGQTQ